MACSKQTYKIWLCQGSYNKTSGGLSLEKAIFDFMLDQGLATNPSGDCKNLKPIGGGTTNGGITTAPPNTLRGNNTSTTGPQVDIPLLPNTLVGRGGTNDISHIYLGSGLSFTGNTLNSIAGATMRENRYVATAGQTIFFIPTSPPVPTGTQMPVRVFRNGVRLEYVIGVPLSPEFTYTGMTITTSACAVNDRVVIEYML